MSGSQIIHIASHVPSKVLTNDYFSQTLDTTDEWITSRTGIKQRHICSDEENSFDMAIESAKKSFESLSENQREEIGGVIVGTSTSSYIFPSLAARIAASLDIKGFAFDLQAACSGFVYPLYLADQIIRNQETRSILVIGVDAVSKVLNWKDRRTCILFGDGAGSCIVTHSKEPKIFGTTISYSPDKEFNLSLKNASFEQERSYIEMDGTKVFKKAVECMSQTVNEVLKKSQLELKDIDLVIPHQANQRIVEALSDHASIPLSKIYNCISWFGNTSAASIPIAVDHAKKDGLLKTNDKILIVSFGGGWTFGGAVFIAP